MIPANTTVGRILIPVSFTCGENINLVNIWTAWSTSNSDQCGDAGLPNFASTCGNYPPSKRFNDIDIGGVAVLIPNFSFACGDATDEVCFINLTTGEASATCDQQFTNSYTPPTINQSGDVTLGSCPDPDAVATAFDNFIAGFSFSGGCNTIESDLSGFSAPPVCGGTTTVTYTVVDDCGGTTVSNTFTIPDDTTPPTFDQAANSADVTLECDDAAGLQDALNFTPTAADNCTTPPTVNLTSDDTVFDPDCAEEYVRTRA